MTTSERRGSSHINPQLPTTDDATIMEKEMITCGSHDTPNESKETSVELFTSPPVKVLEPVTGTGSISSSDLSSVCALNAAYLQCPYSVHSSDSILFHSSGKTELSGNDPELNSEKDSVHVVNSDSDESSSDAMELDDCGIVDTDYDSDFASNRVYFQRRRNECVQRLEGVVSLPPKKMINSSISKRKRKKLRTLKTRYLRHQQREVKHARMTKKKTMWRRNKKLNRVPQSVHNVTMSVTGRGRAKFLTNWTKHRYVYGGWGCACVLAMCACVLAMCACVFTMMRPFLYIDRC